MNLRYEEFCGIVWFSLEVNLTSSILSFGFQGFGMTIGSAIGSLKHSVNGFSTSSCYDVRENCHAHGPRCLMNAMGMLYAAYLAVLQLSQLK